jgi:hypothetical protein
VDFLARLDQDPPGTWIAQPKLDGWRRVVIFTDQAPAAPAGLLFDLHPGWIAYGKRAGAAQCRQMPREITFILDDLASRLQGRAWDCEWMGPRLTGELAGRHHLAIFDLLMRDGQWLREMPFRERISAKAKLILPPAEYPAGPSPIQVVPSYTNPGFVDLFQVQMQDPLSEGLVVRKADSGLVLDPYRSASNPFWFKIKYRNIQEKITI